MLLLASLSELLNLVSTIRLIRLNLCKVAGFCLGALLRSQRGRPNGPRSFAPMDLHTNEMSLARVPTWNIEHSRLGFARSSRLDLPPDGLYKPSEFRGSSGLYEMTRGFRSTAIILLAEEFW